MSQTVLFIGNGFDLDLGLKTNYSQFVDEKWSCFATVHNSGLQKLIDLNRKKIPIGLILNQLFQNISQILVKMDMLTQRM